MKLRDFICTYEIKSSVLVSKVPAGVESLFIFEDLTGLQLLLEHSLLLLCELAPVFLALNTHIAKAVQIRVLY